MKTFALNQNHLKGCPCLGCLQVGDKVLVYLEDEGFEEEIETVITVRYSEPIVQRPRACIGVDWVSHGYSLWLIYSDPLRPKKDCAGTGKVLRKIGR